MKLFLLHISKSKYFWLLSVLLVAKAIQDSTPFLNQNFVVSFLLGIGALVSGANLLVEIRSFLGIGILKPKRVIVLTIETVLKIGIYVLVLIFLPTIIYFYLNPININNTQTIAMLLMPINSIFVGWFSFASALALFQDSSINIPKKSLIILLKNIKSFFVYILIAIITSLIPFIVWVASGMSKEPLIWAYPFRVISSLVFAILLPFLFMKKFVHLKISSGSSQ